MLDKDKIKVGDYLYKMSYYTHPFKKPERSFSKRKIKKISYGVARFNDGDKVGLHCINNKTIDEWYSSKKLMFQGKLEQYLKEYGEPISEIEYLEKRIKQKGEST